MGFWNIENMLPYLDIAAVLMPVAVLLFGLLYIRLFWMKRILTLSRQHGLQSARFNEISRNNITARVNQLCDQKEINVAGEINWLCQVLGEKAEVSSTILELANQSGLKQLAEAYDYHGAHLNRRILLTSEQVPLIGQSIDLAKNTATYLRLLSQGDEKESTGNFRIEMPNRRVSIDFVAFPEPHHGVHAFDLVVSYRNHVLTPDQGDSDRWLDTSAFADVSTIRTSDTEKKNLASTFRSGRSFDGILPRMIAMRTERSAASGRSRMVLSLAACSYSSVILDHYPAEEQVRSYLGNTTGISLVARGVRTQEFVHGQKVGLLTLSMIVVTSDGYIVLPRRSRVAGSHENMYGASVNGNLELIGRSGISLDMDQFGIPDPKRALAREAREELGLAIDVDSIFVSGLAKFDVPTERGTNMLLCVTRVRFTLDELAGQLQYSDLVEGAWEMGEDILGVRLPANQREFDSIMQLFLDFRELTPHATASSIAAIVSLTKFHYSPEDFTPGCCDELPDSRLFRKVSLV